MLAAALRRHTGHGAFDQLEQRLLHALARDVTRDAGVVRLPGDLVDFVNIDNTALSTLNIVLAALQQLLNDVLDVLAHIAGLGQRGGIGHHEGHVELTSQRLGQQGLARTRGTDQQDIALAELHIVLAGLVLVVQTLVVVVDRHGQRALGLLLTDHIIVEIGLDFGGRRQIAATFLGVGGRLFVANDLIAQVDALVADEHGRAGDQLFDLVLAFAAEGAIQILFGGRAFFIGHGGCASLRKNEN
ncbi:hypothetical protein SDC9_131621 [bioreactor metagenome]|uniref:NAD-specific glutamate dehydrogenase n=1 Tax=bioreactor metagenome TaxID=1076179 RepID=A0A645D649_9ZZZZ